MSTLPKYDPNRMVVQSPGIGMDAEWISQPINPANRKERRKAMSSKRKRLREEHP